MLLDLESKAQLRLVLIVAILCVIEVHFHNLFTLKRNEFESVVSPVLIPVLLNMLEVVELRDKS